MLQGKITFITGASRGIGLASARVFAAMGATVIMAARNKQLLDIAVNAILSDVPAAILYPLVCDVADEKSVKSAFQTIFREFRQLDVLLANAGVFDDALIGMVTSEQIQKVFSINTFGVLYCAQYASRLMSRKGSGSIVIVSSIMGSNGNVGQAVYSGSKAALLGITKSLAKELASQNIRVNALTPGFIDTDMAHSVSDEKFAERIASIKMGRIGSPVEVANAALFLASDLSSYITGQVIGVDGGMLI